MIFPVLFCRGDTLYSTHRLHSLKSFTFSTNTTRQVPGKSPSYVGRSGYHQHSRLCVSTADVGVNTSSTDHFQIVMSDNEISGGFQFEKWSSHIFRSNSARVKVMGLHCALVYRRRVRLHSPKQRTHSQLLAATTSCFLHRSPLSRRADRCTYGSNLVEYMCGTT